MGVGIKKKKQKLVYNTIAWLTYVFLIVMLYVITNVDYWGFYEGDSWQLPLFCEAVIHNCVEM